MCENCNKMPTATKKQKFTNCCCSKKSKRCSHVQALFFYCLTDTDMDTGNSEINESDIYSDFDSDSNSD